jgi:hypothetical protein
MALYQLQSAEPDPVHRGLRRRIATIGGWLGRKRDPIGPIVLMRGMLRILDSLALIEQYGVHALRAMGAQIARTLGLPVPGVGAPLRRPRRIPRAARRRSHTSG